MKNILVTVPVDEARRPALEAAAEGVYRYINAKEVTAEDVKDADVILGNIPKELVKRCERLKLLQLNMAGSDGYPELMPKGVLLANSSGAYGLAISEHMLGMLLAVKKRLYEYYENQLASDWRDMGPVTGIEDSVVLSVGMGDIGGEFTRKCKALGAYTIGIRRTVREKPDYVDELYTLKELDSLLPRADVVALSLPSGRETNGLMDEGRLRMMKQGAVLINVGRGAAVNTEALIKVCSEGRIYACLDVTSPEPLPKEHPLWRTKNVFITPHISGFFHLRQTLERIIDIAEENLRRLEKGETLLNLVDAETGYRREENRA